MSLSPRREKLTIRSVARYNNRVYVKDKNHYAKCSWIDKNGDQPATGFQIHWPEFDQASGQRDTGYYCNSRPTLHWFTEPDPNTVRYFTRKRDVFAIDPSTQMSEAPKKQPSGTAVTKRQIEDVNWSKPFAQQLVISSLPGQSASELCNARGSAGPSFVSYEERAFCFMLTKTLFPFCDDVDFGLCWSEDLNTVIPKLIDSLAPAMNFTDIDLWNEDDVNVFG